MVVGGGGGGGGGESNESLISFSDLKIEALKNTK